MACSSFTDATQTGDETIFLTLQSPPLNLLARLNDILRAITEPIMVGGSVGVRMPRSGVDVLVEEKLKSEFISAPFHHALEKPKSQSPYPV